MIGRPHLNVHELGWLQGADPDGWLDGPPEQARVVQLADDGLIRPVERFAFGRVQWQLTDKARGLIRTPDTASPAPDTTPGDLMVGAAAAVGTAINDLIAELAVATSAPRSSAHGCGYSAGLSYAIHILRHGPDESRTIPVPRDLLREIVASPASVHPRDGDPARWDATIDRVRDLLFEGDDHA